VSKGKRVLQPAVHLAWDSELGCCFAAVGLSAASRININDKTDLIPTDVNVI